MFFLLVGKAVNIWLFLSSKACGKGAGALHHQRVGRQLVLSLLMSPVLKELYGNRNIYVSITEGKEGCGYFFHSCLGFFCLF